MKKVAFLTCGRSDISIYRQIIENLAKKNDLQIYLLVFGSHTSNLHGNTIEEVDSFRNVIVKVISEYYSTDTKEEMVSAISKIMNDFNIHLKKSKYDVIFAIGDRFEMLAAVMSASCLGQNIFHLHGGEKTMGAIDNVFRHAISIMSNVHLTSTEASKERVKQIIEDEDSEKVINVGAPALHNISKLSLLNKKLLEEELQLALENYVVLTYHPTTQDPKQDLLILKNILESLLESELMVMMTSTNNDFGNKRF